MCIEKKQLEIETRKEQSSHHGQMEVSPRNKGFLNCNCVLLIIVTASVMCGGLCVWTIHGTGLLILLLTLDSEIELRSSDLCSRCLYLLSHLTSPKETEVLNNRQCSNIIHMQAN